MAYREDVTQLLADLSAGNKDAGNALMPLVYDELRALARSYMRREKSGHTLQTTALVHEAFLKLGGGEEMTWENRGHFLRVAARAMRRILIDHARHKKSDKKGGGWERGALDEAAVFMEETGTDLVALDSALERLSHFDPQIAQMVELRFFGGLTVEDTAQVMGISPRTVMRDWRTAKAWLKMEMEKN